MLVATARHSQLPAVFMVEITPRTLATINWNGRGAHRERTIGGSAGFRAAVNLAGPNRALGSSDDVAGHGLDRGVLMLDQEGLVTSWNDEAARILGVGPGGLQGRSWLSLLTVSEAEGGSWNRALETARLHGTYEAHGWRWRMDGSRFWASVTVRPARDQVRGAPGFMAVVRNLTEDRRRARGLRHALEISRAILAGRPWDAVLQLIADRSRALVGGDCALVRTLGESGNVLVLRATAWRHQSDALLAAPGHELRRRGSITGRVFDTGRPKLVTGRARSLRAQARSETLRPLWPSMGPGLYVSLNAAGHKLGTLVVLNWKTRHPFHRTDLEVLQLLASQAAFAIHHALVGRERERLAVEHERERLGRDLHDGAIQSLYAVTLGLAGTIARTADGGLEEQLAGVAGRIDAVIRGLRAQIHQLRGDLNPIAAGRGRPPFPSSTPRNPRFRGVGPWPAGAGPTRNASPGST